MSYVLRVYSRRWGHADDYHIERTSKGWDIHHGTYKGACNKRGEPVLYTSLANDLVNYPAALGDYLEMLWEEVETGKIAEADIQTPLNALGQWIETCERATPQGIFDALK